MTDDSGTHIASDEELLSRYVLGRLDPAEREAVDRHTAGCGACMEALRREMRIAAGARRLGREELKAELKRRVAAAPRPDVWPRVLGAAAAIGIVAGLGVYYVWFAGGGTLTSRPGVTPPLAGRTESRSGEGGNAPARELADNVKKERKLESSAPSPGRIQREEKASASPAIRDNEQSPAPTAVGVAGSEAARGTPSARPGEFWSDGVVERHEAALDAAAPRGAVTAQERNAVLFESRKVKKEHDRLKDALPRPQGEYLIRQQPVSALPVDRGRSGRDQERVPTRVDQRGDTTTMTMYLDSLVGESELKKARVEAVSDDSVVVTLGGKKILYRFPPGQGAQQRQK